MSVYVDPLKRYARPRGAKETYSGAGELWCHMMADSVEELRAMADMPPSETGMVSTT